MLLIFNKAIVSCWQKPLGLRTQSTFWSFNSHSGKLWFGPQYSNMSNKYHNSPSCSIFCYFVPISLYNVEHVALEVGELGYLSLCEWRACVPLTLSWPFFVQDQAKVLIKCTVGTGGESWLDLSVFHVGVLLSLRHWRWRHAAEETEMSGLSALIYCGVVNTVQRLKRFVFLAHSYTKNHSAHGNCLWNANVRVVSVIQGSLD